MTRALDGRFYRAHTCWRKKCKDKLCYLGEDEDAGEVDWKPAEYATREAAESAWDDSWRDDHEFSVVGPIRPRMSIVKAVRLLTEARGKGVELWMQEQGDDKSRDWYYPDDIFDFHAFTGSQVSSKWIVATPEDARRIDAKRGGK